MVWFRVDDNLPTNYKVLAIPRDRRAGAIGVWTLAGAWSSANLTNGFVPDYALAEIPGSSRYRQDLIRVGLWIPSRSERNVDGIPSRSERDVDGIQFNNWAERQPSRDEVEEKRKDHAARQAAYRARLKAARDASRDVTGDTTGDTPVTTARPDPTRPDPVVPSELPKRGDDATRRARRLPADFAVSDDMRAWAKARVPGLDVDLSTERFCNYWKAASGKSATKLDWPATWQNWLLSDFEKMPRPNGRPNLQLAPGVRRQI